MPLLVFVAKFIFHFSSVFDYMSPTQLCQLVDVLAVLLWNRRKFPLSHAMTRHGFLCRKHTHAKGNNRVERFICQIYCHRDANAGSRSNEFMCNFDVHTISVQNSYFAKNRIVFSRDSWIMESNINTYLYLYEVHVNVKKTKNNFRRFSIISFIEMLCNDIFIRMWQFTACMTFIIHFLTHKVQCIVYKHIGIIIIIIKLANIIFVFLLISSRCVTYTIGCPQNDKRVR